MPFNQKMYHFVPNSLEVRSESATPTAKKHYGPYYVLPEFSIDQKAGKITVRVK
jgi:uncharacterized protein YcaQ